MSGDELAVLRKTWDIYITDMATNGCDAFIRLVILIIFYFMYILKNCMKN